MWQKNLIPVYLLCMTQFAAAGIQIDGVAAVVNAHVITVSDVLGASTTLQQKLRQGQAGQEANDLFVRILDELIDRKLIADSYENQREIKIPPMMVDERVREAIQDMFRDDRNAFLRALGEDGHSEKSWRNQIREQLVVRSMRNLRVDRFVRISPTEVRARFDAEPDRFSRPAVVSYRMLVIDHEEDVSPAGRRGQIQDALAAGESFDAVTRRFSIDRFAEQGGLRGPVEMRQLRDEVREPLEGLDAGQFAGPFALGQHMIWLQLEEKTQAVSASFVEAYDQIEQMLFRERAEELYRNWLGRLRSDAFITVKVSAPF
jgi:parvulin-like peptidyl-prolyl isomerase